MDYSSGQRRLAIGYRCRIVATAADGSQWLPWRFLQASVASGECTTCRVTTVRRWNLSSGRRRIRRRPPIRGIVESLMMSAGRCTSASARPALPCGRQRRIADLFGDVGERLDNLLCVLHDQHERTDTLARSRGLRWRSGRRLMTVGDPLVCRSQKASLGLRWRAVPGARRCLPTRPAHSPRVRASERLPGP